MQHLNSLETLFVDELRDLYDAEHQIINALPKMMNAASSQDLRKAFEDHLQVTRNQVDRLEQIFSDLNQTPSGKTCQGMQGIIKEGEKIIQAQGDPAVIDAALITAAQRVEHYEIAGYGTVRTWADELGMGDAADLLQKTLDEEGKTNERLTKIATGGLFTKGVNVKAEKGR